MKTGLVWDERYFWHDFGDFTRLFPHNPHLQPGSVLESPESKRRILNLLEISGLAGQLQTIRPRSVGTAELSIYHDRDYIDRVKKISDEGWGEAGPMAPIPRGGFETAALAVGGTWAAIDAVLRGEVSNCYALVRPPGHHAEKAMGMGLCVFANAAVATLLAMKEHQLSRVAILDWDAHHGNGTESAFYERDDVLTISIHQDMAIAAERGGLDDDGCGAGKGFNINLPLPPGSGTGAYLACMDRVVIPAIERFQPDLIVVASGVDASGNDPTARMLLCSDSYRMLTERMVALAQRVCNGRLVMTHEGGYEPTMAPFCTLAIIEQLSGIKTEAQDPFGPLTEDSLSGYHQLQPHQEHVVRAAEAKFRLGAGR